MQPVVDWHFSSSKAYESSWVWDLLFYRLHVKLVCSVCIDFGNFTCNSYFVFYPFVIVLLFVLVETVLLLLFIRTILVGVFIVQSSVCHLVKYAIATAPLHVYPFFHSLSISFQSRHQGHQDKLKVGQLQRWRTPKRCNSEQNLPVKVASLACPPLNRMNLITKSLITRDITCTLMTAQNSPIFAVLWEVTPLIWAKFGEYLKKKGVSVLDKKWKRSSFSASFVSPTPRGILLKILQITLSWR